jgi:hypothetical protein
MSPVVGGSPIGATAPASPSSPSEHRRHKARSPRPYGHAEDGATHQVWGHGLRRADLRSRPANTQRGGPPIHAAPTRSWPTSARSPPRAPAQQRNTRSPLTGGSALDGAVPYQKVKRLGHGFRNFTNYRLRLLLHCGIR